MPNRREKVVLNTNTAATICNIAQALDPLKPKDGVLASAVYYRMEHGHFVCIHNVRTILEDVTKQQQPTSMAKDSLTQVCVSRSAKLRNLLEAHHKRYLLED